VKPYHYLDGKEIDRQAIEKLIELKNLVIVQAMASA